MRSSNVALSLLLLIMRRKTATKKSNGRAEFKLNEEERRLVDMVPDRRRQSNPLNEDGNNGEAKLL